MVRQWFAKPSFVGSIPTSASSIRFVPLSRGTSLEARGFGASAASPLSGFGWFLADLLYVRLQIVFEQGAVNRIAADAGPGSKAAHAPAVESLGRLAADSVDDLLLEGRGEDGGPAAALRVQQAIATILFETLPPQPTA